jgi:hypothetical protein
LKIKLTLAFCWCNFVKYLIKGKVNLRYTPMSRSVRISVLIIFLISLTLYLTSCKKKSILPIVTTTDVSAITETTASTGGNVTDDGGAAITFRGVCRNTSENPTLANGHTTDGSGAGSFISNLH